MAKGTEPIMARTARRASLMERQDQTKGDSTGAGRVSANFKLPAEIHRALKEHAARKGLTATSYLIIALNDAFDRDDRGAGR